MGKRVWLLLEIVSAPVRLIVTLATFLGMFFINVYYLLQGTCIYNHILVLLRRSSHVIYPWRLSEADLGKKKEINQIPLQESVRPIPKSGSQTLMKEINQIPLQESDRPIPKSGSQTPKKLQRSLAKRWTSTS